MTSPPVKLRECDFLFFFFHEHYGPRRSHFPTLPGVVFVGELLAGVPGLFAFPAGTIKSQKQAMSTDCISRLSRSAAELQYLYDAIEPDRWVYPTARVLAHIFGLTNCFLWLFECPGELLKRRPNKEVCLPRISCNITYNINNNML